MKPFNSVETRVILLYGHNHDHDQLYKHICMQNHNNDTKTSDTVLRKIYFSLYLKGLCMRGSWRPNRTATYWPPHSYGHQPFFPVLQGYSTGGPGSQLSAGCWLFLPSCLQTLRSPNCSIRGPEGPFCQVLAFSTASFLQPVWSPKLTDFLSSLSYIIVQSPTQSLEWHVWSSSSGNNCHAVHRSLSSSASVYDCTMGF